MKQLMPFIFILLLSACTTTQYVYLIEPDKQISEEHNYIPSGEAKFNFRSARSMKENSIVEIGGWHIILGEHKQVFRFDIKITNNSNNYFVWCYECIIRIICNLNIKSKNLLIFTEYYIPAAYLYNRVFFNASCRIKIKFCFTRWYKRLFF